MPARQKSKKQSANLVRTGDEHLTAGRRKLCSRLMFYIACGHAKCERAHACVCDANECFPRLWRIVPEELKISIRAEIKARNARLSPPEIRAAIERDLARWWDMTTPKAVAEPPQPSVPVALAKPGPRVRVL